MFPTLNDLYGGWILNEAMILWIRKPIRFRPTGWKLRLVPSPLRRINQVIFLMSTKPSHDSTPLLGHVATINSQRMTGHE